MNDCSNVSIAKLTHDMFRPDVWIRYLHRAWEFPFPIFYNNSVGIEMDTHFIGIGNFISTCPSPFPRDFYGKLETGIPICPMQISIIQTSGLNI